MGSPEVQTNRIRFEPGLEGLRGLLLPAVLCYHAEFAWAKGGFLALPTFFTLSGYLITSLFLAEWKRSGDLRVGQFWGRRFRRLMPAMLLTLGAMPLFGAFIATPDQLERLRADVLWSLVYLANWHFVITSASYLELFALPSPLQHFWSLAVEEQFYFLYPLLALLVLRRTGGSRSALAVVLGALVIASVMWSVVLRETGASIDRVYYGSDTRAAEIFLGALLATLSWGREISSAVLRRGVSIGGGLALLAMLALWGSVNIDEGWLYRGGSAAYSLLSVAVIAGAVQPDGPARAMLSGRLLRWLGRLSYGAYLFHWPIYLWLSEDRTGLGPWPLLALRTAVTLALAEISYRFVESPIRSGRFLNGWQPFVATALAFSVVGASIAWTPTGTPRAEGVSSEDEAALERYLEDFLKRNASGAHDSDRQPSLHHETPRIALFGDSTAATLAPLLYDLESTGRARVSKTIGELGCGVLREGVSLIRRKQVTWPAHCRSREEVWAEAIANGRPDIAVVSEGPWDVTERKLPGDPRWRSLGDPVLDARLLEEMVAAVDLLGADGALVVWLTAPPIELRDRRTGRPPKPPYVESDPARMARFNELIFELPRLRPGRIRVIDLAAHMATRQGGSLDPDYRPDGVHWSPLGGLRLSREWLADELLRVYRDQAKRASRERGESPS